MSHHHAGHPGHDDDPRYRAPRDCPVCSEQLHVTRLGCDQCGTALSGAFASCEFCGLGRAERDLLRVFLTSRGNMKDVERHLGVSYPTARARFDDLLRALGYLEPQRSAVDPRLATLQALADGALDMDTARARLEERS